MSGCFVSLIEGEFYDPACDAFHQWDPENDPDGCDPRGLATCAECDEDFWRAMNAAANARVARVNGKAH
jgi:hypothetical protein